ncbi:hypothetical protein MSG28_011665 [Choristoneura fumiferana]|uniref:Uncharacterized protein n=1 Tax=Choristoneura fumiferana TaxID=7141 RepID=A0ACC0KLI2_CHOFU|nr:hypothetical protein MSG28_011665 [Choristoneura fumiferana]
MKQALISSTCTSLASVASSTSSLAADVSRVQAAHSSSLQSAQHQLEQFRAELERALQHQDDLERARLEEQFRVYSPTGNDTMSTTRKPFTTRYTTPRDDEDEDDPTTPAPPDKYKDSGNIACPGVCVEARLTQYCEAYLTTRDLCVSTRLCCVSRDGLGDRPPSDLVVPNEKKHTKRPTTALTTTPQPSKYKGPLRKCRGDCISGLFALLCDHVDEDAHCPGEGTCCITEPKGELTTRRPTTTRPTTPIRWDRECQCKHCVHINSCTLLFVFDARRSCPVAAQAPLPRCKCYLRPCLPWGDSLRSSKHSPIPVYNTVFSQVTLSRCKGDLSPCLASSKHSPIPMYNPVLSQAPLPRCKGYLSPCLAWGDISLRLYSIPTGLSTPRSPCISQCICMYNRVLSQAPLPRCKGYCLLNIMAAFCERPAVLLSHTHCQHSGSICCDNSRVPPRTTPRPTTTTSSTTAAPPDPRPDCPGSCIVSLLSFTCFRNAEMTDVFKCKKAGTQCCAPKSKVLEVSGVRERNDTYPLATAPPREHYTQYTTTHAPPMSEYTGVERSCLQRFRASKKKLSIPTKQATKCLFNTNSCVSAVPYEPTYGSTLRAPEKYNKYVCGRWLAAARSTRTANSQSPVSDEYRHMFRVRQPVDMLQPGE